MHPDATRGAVATPSVALVLPSAPAAFGGAMEHIVALITPAQPGLTAEVRVDGATVPCTLRAMRDGVAVSAWCDTRGLPSGIHEIEVSAAHDDGPRASAACLLTVVLGESAGEPASAAEGVEIAVIAADDPGLGAALSGTARGRRPLVVLTPGTELAPGGRDRIGAAFAGAVAPDLVIADEASMLGDERWLRWRKHGFQPETLPCVDQVGPLLAVGPRAAAVLCDGPPLSTPYELALELLDHELRAVAIPSVACLTPAARLPTDDASARAAVQRLAERRGRPVTIAAGAVSGLREVRWPLADPPDIAVVIASRTADLTARCLAGLSAATDYPRLRAIVVDSTEDRRSLAAAVAASPLPVTHLPYPEGEPFNYQRAVNLGAAAAGDAHVLFLNDDVVPLTSDWLERMAELLTLDGVGVVGAMLRFPDGRIQHAGVSLTPGLHHVAHDAPGDWKGRHFALCVPGNPPAVTGACMLVRREVLAQIDGHDEGFVHVFGDIDLCLRARAAGWRVAWCPGAELEHLESATYGSLVTEADSDRYTDRWASGPENALE